MTTITISAREIREALGAKRGSKLVRCPAHDDRTPSLSIDEGLGGTVLVHCHAGCTQDAVINVLRERGLWPRPDTWRDPLADVPRRASRRSIGVTRYEIRDIDGTLVATHAREDFEVIDADGVIAHEKRVWFEPSGITTETLPLYGVHELKPLSPRAVVGVEGEKARDALAARGVVAVGTACGANTTPCDDALRPLLGRPAILWPDNDDIGRQHMARIAERLAALGHDDVRFVAWPDAPPKGDAADFTGTDAELAALLEAAGTSAHAGPRLASDADFWSSTPTLQHIHEYAVSRIASPWAVLGCVLARVIASMPPSVMLPPVIGGPASLNLYVACVGPPGTGKGAAMRVAETYIENKHHDFRSSSLGTGQGVAHAFAYYSKKDEAVVARTPPSVLFTVDEVDSIKAHLAQQASTLSDTLRRAFMGEALGAMYADAARRIEVPAHTYRMCVVVGVQPERAGALLDDAAGGTPQRFLWMPATYDIPDELPPPPARAGWTRPASLSGVVREMALDIPDEAREEIVAAARARVRGEADVLDGHALLVRLKVAAALAALHGRWAVDLEDWQLAGQVMAVSDATRAEIQAKLAEADAKRERSYAKRLSGRTRLAADELVQHTFLRVQGVIVRHVERGKCAGGCKRRCITRAVASQDASVVSLDEVLSDAIARQLLDLDDATSIYTRGKGTR